jgi:serine protease Do
MKATRFTITLLLATVIVSMAGTSVALTPKAIYQKVGPAVVFIFASLDSKTGSGGTGSIIDPDGTIITNAHLFTVHGSDRILRDVTVYLKPDRVTGQPKTDLSKGYKGRVVAFDRAMDLAVVKISDAGAALPTVTFADSQQVEVGDQVFAIGHPEQGGLWSLTTGVVSALWKDYGGTDGKNLFQTDASINRGNSGGPLLDQDGDMVGINSMIARKAPDGLTITDVNFAIRSNVAIQWLNKHGYHAAAHTKTSGSTQVATTTPESPQPPASTQQPPAVSEPEPPVASATGHPPESGEPPAASDVAAGQSGQSQSAAPEDRILTEKHPYDLDKLTAAEEELENMADEIKNFFKQQ